MAESKTARTPRNRCTLRAAVVVTTLACVLLLWESIADSPSPLPSPRPPRATSRARPKSPPQVARKVLPAAVVAPVPEPPPPPPVVIPVDPSTLRLEDIVIDLVDPSARFAVIDGVAVRAGETIGGHPIRKVLADRVLIGEESEVTLLPEDEDR